MTNISTSNLFFPFLMNHHHKQKPSKLIISRNSEKTVPETKQNNQLNLNIETLHRAMQFSGENALSGSNSRMSSLNRLKNGSLVSSKTYYKISDPKEDFNRIQRIEGQK
jgi:hypothetical protein